MLKYISFHLKREKEHFRTYFRKQRYISDRFAFTSIVKTINQGDDCTTGSEIHISVKC